MDELKQGPANIQPGLVGIYAEQQILMELTFRHLLTNSRAMMASNSSIFAKIFMLFIETTFFNPRL